MPFDPGGASGGLGSVCAPSPQDLLASVENLLDRIKFLEDQMAIMLGENVAAGELSELSQQVGWVDAITYNGQGGFTRTEYGTLIPPPGVSLSSLGWTLPGPNGTRVPYPFVVMDENGVLQFGASATGHVSGEAIDAGKQLAMLYTADLGSVNGNNTILNFPISVGYDPDDLIAFTSDSVFHVSRSGYYNLSITTNISMDNATTPSVAEVVWSIDSGNFNPTFPDPNQGRGPCINYPFETAGGFFGSRFSSAKMMYLKTNIDHHLSVTTTGVGTDFNLGSLTITFQLIKTG